MEMRAGEAVRAAILVALSCSATAVFAQESAPTDAGQNEDIIVTGIRRSLQQALEVKRQSNQIVDTIASESLGKFPDTNIAESLQRIPGVSIDRAGGEGQTVTVRGFGPEFNTVLLNGRRLVSDSGGRAFNFDVLPAELVSSVNVFKSSPSDLQDGGIGSTIVLNTLRPLDVGKRQIVVSAKALYEDLSGKVTPQFFGLYSDTFADDRFGIMIAGSYQRRKNRIDRFLTDGYLSAPRDSLTLIAADLAGRGYSADDQFFIPQNLNVSPVTEDRERITVNTSLQFQATDALKLTVDGLYNRFNVKSVSNTLTFFTTPSIITAAQFDQNRTATGFTQTIDAAVDNTRSERSRPTDLWQGGFNAVWDVAGNAQIIADTNYSRAKSGGAKKTGVVVLGFRNARDIYTLNYDDKGFPSVTGVVPADVSDPSLPKAHFTMLGGGGGPLGGGADIKDQLFEQKLDFKYTPDGGPLSKLAFGGYYGRQKQSLRTRLSADPILCLYCGYATDVPDSLFRPYSISKNYLDGRLDVPTTWLAADVNETVAFLESDAGAAARDQALGLAPGTSAAILRQYGGFQLVERPNSSRVKEEIFGGYVDVVLKGDVARMPWTVNLGARYVRTKTTAFGISQPLQDLISSGDPTLYQPVLGEPQTVSESNTYYSLLPSLAARLNLTDNLVARFAATETVTRPPLGALSPRLVIGTTRPGNLQASSGNPNLAPFEAFNLDLGLEWYYQRNGYVSVALFRKEVQNFLVNVVQNRVFPITDRDNLFNGDPTFEVSTQDNLEKATVKGIELSAQHTFDYLPGALAGFGFQVNATFVSSNAKLDTDDLSQTFALQGLGDSYNAVLFYDYGGLEARIAWNRREKFLQTAVGFGGEPAYVKPYQQIDARISYRIFDNVSVFAEGVNITDEVNQRVGRYENQILLYEKTGPRYAIGVRAEF
jgi:iron complex outermembrane recepter protein